MLTIRVLSEYLQASSFGFAHPSPQANRGSFHYTPQNSSSPGDKLPIINIWKCESSFSFVFLFIVYKSFDNR